MLLPSITGSKTPRATSFMVDDGSPPADPRVDEGAWPGPSREAMRASRHFPESFRADGRSPFAVGISPSRCFLVPIRPHGCPQCAQGVLPWARLPGSMRRHGRRPPGRWVEPSACLPVTIRPHGCPRSRHGYSLHAYWQHPSGHRGVRVARRGASFFLIARSIMPDGYTLYVPWVCRSAGGDHPSTMKDGPIR
jgi:hypothetical protein